MNSDCCSRTPRWGRVWEVEGNRWKQGEWIFFFFFRYSQCRGGLTLTKLREENFVFVAPGEQRALRVVYTTSISFIVKLCTAQP